MARTDYQTEWDSYNEESRPHGLSMREHCLRRGVSYPSFLRWKKKNIDAVTITEVAPSAPEDPVSGGEVLYFSVELSNSLRLTQQNIGLSSCVPASSTGTPSPAPTPLNRCTWRSAKRSIGGIEKRTCNRMNYKPSALRALSRQKLITAGKLFFIG